MQTIRVDDQIEIRQVEEYVWEVLQQGEMRVPGRIYTDRHGIRDLASEAQQGGWSSLRQVVNVACLPGIQLASMAMADVHPGYGFPIGGVGAFDMEEGVVSVAGVGYGRLRHRDEDRRAFGFGRGDDGLQELEVVYVKGRDGVRARPGGPEYFVCVGEGHNLPLSLKYRGR